MRILVTGTTGGIGGAVKIAAQERGWQVVEVNRGGFAAPLGDAPFDAVVFATGTCPIKPLQLLKDEELAETISVNCGLFVSLVRRLLSEKLNNPARMKVVAVSSVSATEGWAGGIAYCASKGALSAACRAMNIELKAKNISVEALEPRYVKTRMFDEGAGRMGVPAGAAQDPRQFAEEILDVFN